VSFIGAAPSGTAEKAKDIAWCHNAIVPQTAHANHSPEKRLIFSAAVLALVAVLGPRFST